MQEIQGTEENSKLSKTVPNKQDSQIRVPSGRGNVGFATPGLSSTAPQPG